MNNEASLQKRVILAFIITFIHPEGERVTKYKVSCYHIPFYSE